MSELLPDKLTFVKNHTRSVLVGRGAIDNSGRILNLVQYRTIIEIEINEREKDVKKYATIDGIVIDRESVSELLWNFHWKKMPRRNTICMESKICSAISRGRFLNEITCDKIT